MDLDQFRRIYSDYAVDEAVTKSAQYASWDYSMQQYTMRPALIKEKRYFREDSLKPEPEQYIQKPHLQFPLFEGIRSSHTGGVQEKFLSLGDLFNHVGIDNELFDIVRSNLTPMQDQIFIQSINNLGANEEVPAFRLAEGSFDYAKACIAEFMSLKRAIENANLLTLNKHLSNLESLENDPNLVTYLKPPSGKDLLALLLAIIHAFVPIKGFPDDSQFLLQSYSSGSRIPQEDGLPIGNVPQFHIIIDPREKDEEGKIKDSAEGFSVTQPTSESSSSGIPTATPRLAGSGSCGMRGSGLTDLTSLKNDNSTYSFGNAGVSAPPIEPVNEKTVTNMIRANVAKDYSTQNFVNETNVTRPPIHMDTEFQRTSPDSEFVAITDADVKRSKDQLLRFAEKLRQAKAAADQSLQQKGPLNPFADINRYLLGEEKDENVTKEGLKVDPVQPPSSRDDAPDPPTEFRKEFTPDAPSTDRAPNAQPGNWWSLPEWSPQESSPPSTQSTQPASAYPIGAPNIPAFNWSDMSKTSTPSPPSSSPNSTSATYDSLSPSQSPAATPASPDIKSPQDTMTLFNSLVDKAWVEQSEPLLSRLKSSPKDVAKAMALTPQSQEHTSFFYLLAGHRMDILQKIEKTPKLHGLEGLQFGRKTLAKRGQPVDMPNFEVLGLAGFGKPPEKRPRDLGEDGVPFKSLKPIGVVANPYVDVKVPSRYQHVIVQTLKVLRSPLPQFMNEAFEALSNNTWAALKRKHAFDDFFHLAMVVNGDLLIEKNASGINISEYKPYNAESYEVSREKMGKFNMQTMMQNAQAMMGDKYYSYDPFSNNCQGFIQTILRSNGLLTEPLNKFVYQPVEALLKDLPTHFLPIAKAAAAVYGSVQAHGLM